MRFLAFLISGGLLATLTAQQKPPEKCSIDGQAANGITGEPLKKALVVLRRVDTQPGGGAFTTTSDATGKFSIPDIEPGRYRLTVSRAGFLQQEYGSRHPGRQGTVITLSPGQNLTKLDFKLMPHGVISGKVVDEDGDPVVYANLQLLRPVYNNGRKQLGGSNGAATNDLGEFRIFAVPPGKYYLQASYRRGLMMESNTRVSGELANENFAPTYYPGTLDPQTATQIAVSPGSDLAGINLVLRKTRMYRVSGRIVNLATNRPNRMLTVYLMPRDSNIMAINRTMTNVRDKEGKFQLRDVPPGSYYLIANHMDGNQRYSARIPIDIGQNDVEGLNVALSQGGDLGGQIRLDGSGEIAMTDVQLTLNSDSLGMVGDLSGTQVAADGKFMFRNLGPDTYHATVSGLPDNFCRKSIQLGDQDVSETGLSIANGAGTLQIVLSPNCGQIEGTVADAKEKAAAGASVALIPAASRRQDLYKLTSTDQNGHFKLIGIPPGDYKVFAWEDLEPGAQTDPDFISPVEKYGAAVSIKEGSHETLQMKLIPAEENGERNPQQTR